MKKKALSLYHCFLALCLIIFTLKANTQDTTRYQSTETAKLLEPERPITLNHYQRWQVVTKAAKAYKKAKSVLDDATEEKTMAFFENIVNPSIHVIAETASLIDKTKVSGSALKVAANLLDKAYVAARKEDLPHKVEFQIKKSAIANQIFTDVKRLCKGITACINAEAEKIIRDPLLRETIGEDVELFNEAAAKQLIVSAAERADTNALNIRKDIKTLAEFEEKSTRELGVQIKEAKRQATIAAKNSAALLHKVDMYHRAVASMKNSIDSNNKIIQGILESNTKKLDTVLVLQRTNLDLSQTILNSTRVIERKIDTIGQDVKTIKHRQLQQIYDELPTAKRLEFLKKNGTEYFKGDTAAFKNEVKTLLLMKDLEEVVATTKKIRELGYIGKEALNVFCPDCPKEIAQGIDLAVVTSDIIGSVATGNWSQAISAGLGMFRKPSPGPELIMLQRISSQIKQLETNMDNKFRNLEQQLYAMEQNIVARLDIIDLRLQNITDILEKSYTDFSTQLSTLEGKTNYIIRQNECTEKTILELFNSQNTNICKDRVAEFKRRKSSGNIKNFNDLKAFYLGQDCRPCIEALFRVSSVDVSELPAFNYTNCPLGTTSARRQPHKLYRYIYNNLLLSQNKSDPLAIFSMFLIPSDVKTATTVNDLVKGMEQPFKQNIRTAFSKFNLNDNDPYRNYQMVLEYADYALNMFPFLELYSNGELLPLESIRVIPGFSKERAQRLTGMLENIALLINKTIFQQSAMTGMGSYQGIDNWVKNKKVSIVEEDGSSLKDLFDYDPHLNNNFAAYFINKNYGLNGLANTLKTTTESKPQIRFINEYKSTISKSRAGDYKLQLSTRDGETPFLEATLPTVTSKSDVMQYNQFLSYSLPYSIIELIDKKNQINDLRAEMQLIQSDDLNKPGSTFSRRDLATFVQLAKDL